MLRWRKSRRRASGLLSCSQVSKDRAATKTEGVDMTQKDFYIAKIDAALDDYDDAEGEVLVKEVISVFAGEDEYIKSGLDRFRSRVSVPGSPVSYDNRGDLKRLRGKLVSLREAERRALEADLARLPLLAAEDDIDECERLLASGEDAEARRFIDRMVQVYGAEIENIAVGLTGYGYASEDETFEGDLAYVLSHLKHYRANLALELAKSASSPISVNASAVNQNSVEVALTVTQVAEQIQSLPDDVLSDEQKNEIKALLLDLDMAKGKSRGDAEKPLGKVLSWLADKGVDVGIAVLPYVAQTLAGL